MIRRPPRSTQSRSSAASDVYKRQVLKFRRLIPGDEPSQEVENSKRDGEMVNTRHLYRSRQSRVIAGVAGGLGHYFNVDPVLFRIGFVLMAFTPAAPVSILGYIALAIVMEKSPSAEMEPPITSSVTINNLSLIHISEPTRL